MKKCQTLINHVVLTIIIRKYKCLKFIGINTIFWQKKSIKFVILLSNIVKIFK